MVRTFNALLQNSTLAIAAKVLNQLGFALLFIGVSRQLGADEAGVFSLALRYTTLFLTLALWGLEGYLIRELAAGRENPRRLILTSGISRTLFACLSFVLLGLLTGVVIDYRTDIRWVIFLLATSLVPEALNRTFQAIFIAYQEFVYPAIVSFILSLIRVLLGGSVIWVLGRLDILAIVLSLTSLVGVILYSSLFWWQRRAILPPGQAAARGGSGGLQDMTSWGYLRRHLVQANPFALMEIFYAVEWQVDVLILSFFLPADQIGYYAAAQTIVALLSFVHYGYHISLYPLMTRLYTQDAQALWRFYTRLMRYIGIAVLPAGLLLTMLTYSVIALIYDPGFAPAAGVMQWLIWVVVLQLLDEPNSRMIIIAGHQKHVMNILAASMALNILLNIVLIPSYGILGSAWAKLISKLFFVLLNGLGVYRKVSQINLLPTLGRLAAAGLVMGAAVYFSQPAAPALRLLTGLLAYGGAILATGLINKSDLQAARAYADGFTGRK